MKLARVIAIFDAQDDSASRGHLLRVCELRFDGTPTDAEYVVLSSVDAKNDDMILLEESDTMPQYRAIEIVQSIETLAREETHCGAAQGRIV